MRISLIAAVARNGVIGREGDLPWRLRTDQRRFKRLTMGHAMVMGRRTWESLGGRVLPGRHSIVLTRGELEVPEGVLVVHSWDEAVAAARRLGVEELVAIGGTSVYAAALPVVDRLYLTDVDAEVEGDARFPDCDRDQFRLVEEEEVPAGPHDEHPTTYRRYERSPGPS